jgi:hypothetical protein
MFMSDSGPKTCDPKKIIIEGVTEEGKQFRPSDWAERMSGSLCTFSNHRVTYSPLLQPMVKGGNKCVLMDPVLKESNPALYDSIMEFVHANKLRTCEEDDDKK